MDGVLNTGRMFRHLRTLVAARKYAARNLQILIGKLPGNKNNRREYYNDRRMRIYARRYVRSSRFRGWDEYYTPLQQHLTEFRKRYSEDTAAREVIASIEEEISMFRRYSRYYGYVFYLMQRKQ
jgi:hypothetical protein